MVTLKELMEQRPPCRLSVSLALKAVVACLYRSWVAWRVEATEQQHQTVDLTERKPESQAQL